VTALGTEANHANISQNLTEYRRFVSQMGDHFKRQW